MENLVNFRPKDLFITLKWSMPTAQVPSDIRTSAALHLPGHPQHPPLLRHEESRAEAAEADNQPNQQQHEEK